MVMTFHTFKFKLFVLIDSISVEILKVKRHRVTKILELKHQSLLFYTVLPSKDETLLLRFLLQQLRDFKFIFL